MEERNSVLQKNINDIARKDKRLKNLNILLITIIIVIAVIVLIHKLYLKENTYSIFRNEIVNSVETVVIENKGEEKSDNDTKYYIEFSNDKMKNKIYVNKGVYDNCKLGDETKVNVKDIYDKKGNILKEELLFDIID